MLTNISTNILIALKERDTRLFRLTHIIKLGKKIKCHEKPQNLDISILNWIKLQK